MKWRKVYVFEVQAAGCRNAGLQDCRSERLDVHVSSRLTLTLTGDGPKA